MLEFVEIVVLLVVVWIGEIHSMRLEKIVGGKAVEIESVPYTLSLRLSGTHACGASIINDWWAATAAHCVVAAGGDPSKISVRSGSSWWKSGGTLHRGISAFVHEKYSDTNQDYDIAVLKVDPPFSFNNSTQPVVLMEKKPSVDRSWGWVSGWGYEHEHDRKVPRKLRATAIPQIEWKECSKDYADRLTKQQVCYGFREGKRDSCKGDSGSPLVNKDFILLGITSWGEGCGQQNSPGVYTNVLLLRDWILATIN